MSADTDQGTGPTQRGTFTRIALRSVGFLLLLVLWLSIDWSSLPALLAGSEPGLWAWAAAGFFLFTLAKSVRWHLLLLAMGIDYGLGRSLRVYHASAFLAFVTPGRVGDVAKAAFLKADVGVSLATGLASTLADRLLDLAVLTAIAGAAVLFAAPAGPFRTALLIFFGLALIPLGLFARPQLATTALDALERVPGLGSRLSPFRARISSVGKPLTELRGASLLAPLGLTVTQFGMLFLGAYFLARGLDLPLGFPSLVYCVTVASVVSLIPVSVSGIGTRDAALVLLFAQYGVPAPHALAFSLAYLLFSLVFSNGLGFLFWLSRPPDLISLERRA